MQRVESYGGKFAPDLWPSYVGARSRWWNLLAMGPDRRALSMDLLVTIIQIVKDLLGSVNPLRLFRRDYRDSFWKVWGQEPLVFRIGYVLGAISLFVLIALAVFWFLRGTLA